MSLLGVDIGTSGCKAGVFGVDGKVLASARRSYALQSPGPGLLEMNVESVKAAVLGAIGEACAEGRGKDVQALGISSLGDVVVPVDRSGRVTHNPILDVDPRGAAESLKLVERLGAQKIYEITGMPPGWFYGICKIMWLRQNAAESQQAVARYLCFDGLVMRWLGSEGLIEHSLAARTMGFDIVRKEWAPEVLAAAGLDPNLMPPAQPPATVVGGVARDVAHELGLKPATPIVTGAHDWVCAVAASGVQPGRRQATDIMGSLEGLLVPTRGPFLQAAARAQGYSTYCGPSSETYVTMGFIPTAGVLLQWCKDTLAEGEAGHGPAAGRDPFGLMVSAALRAKAGVTVIPHFSGRGTPDFEPAMRGRIYGLSLDTTRAEIVRGVVEGLCCELRHNLEVLDGLGLTLDELHCVGGGARSNEWLQLKADITGKAVSAHDNVEGSCTGAAIFAGLGVGLLDSAGSAAQTWGGPPRRFAPSASRRPEMDQLYAGYLKLRQGLG